MILGMSKEDTVKKLLSPEMFEAYVKMSQGQVLGFTQQTGNSSSTQNSNSTFQSMIQDVISITAMIVRQTIIYCPVKTGKMRESLYTESVGTTGMKIGFGVDYAIFPHEVGYYMHKSPTRYKFLEDAAFEVALELDTPYRISISYNPLEVYINVPDMGTDLVQVKAKEKVNRLVSRRNRVLNDFLNFDSSTASDEDILYHEKMLQFFDWWRHKGNSDWSIVDEWQDRQRHD